jgi:Spy/CpxP family protein refolding chaperone
MYPGFIPRWRSRRCESRVGEGAGYGYGEPWHRGFAYSAAGEEESGHFGFGGGAFGVRRPLRFLAYKLELEEAQVSELARILDEIKTERAQAAVDHRRALSAFAEAITGDAFDESRAGAGAKLRVDSAERLRAAVVSALSRLHALLTPEQRAKLAYLIRTGTLTI